VGPELYFLLVYEIPTRELEIHEFERDFEAASEAYTRLELQHRDSRDIEVVLVGADSIETIHRTHSHYFAEQADDLFNRFLEIAPDGREVRLKTVRRKSRRQRGDS
jgi:hypothetical protein